MRGRAVVFLLVMSAATAGYFFAPESWLVGVYNAIAVTAAVAMLAVGLRARIEPAGAWLLLALGTAASAGGDIVFGAGQFVPSPADMLYVSAYPLWALGLSGLSPWRESVRRNVNIAMAAGIAAAVALVCWSFLVLPGGDGESGLSARLVSIGYPVMDVALIGLLLRARESEHQTALKLVGVGLGLMLAADLVYMTSNFGNGYELGGAIDAAWLISYAFFGTAVLALRPTWTAVERVGTELPEITPASFGGGTAVIERVAVRSSTLAVGIADLRFSLILGWTGRILLAFGVVAMFLGLAWQSPNIVLLAGAYVLCGAVTSIVGGRGIRL